MSWDRLCRLLEENGVGLVSLHNRAIAFSYKLWCIYRMGDSIGAKFMRSKHGDFSYFRIYRTPLSRAFRTWSRVLSVWEEAEQH